MRYELATTQGDGKWRAVKHARVQESPARSIAAGTYACAARRVVRFTSIRGKLDLCRKVETKQLAYSRREAHHGRSQHFAFSTQVELIAKPILYTVCAPSPHITVHTHTNTHLLLLLLATNSTPTACSSPAAHTASTLSVSQVFCLCDTYSTSQCAAYVIAYRYTLSRNT